MGLQGLARSLVALVLCLCCSGAALAALGVLKVTSEPSGVVVSLDGKRVARTPCKLGVPTGKHTITAEARRHDPDACVVTIKEGEETSVHLTLLPTPIEIKVKCKLEDAAIYVDGVNVGLVNEVVNARPGARELVVVKDGYKDYVRKIRIPWRTSGSKPKEYKVTLREGISFRSGSILSPDGWKLEGGWRFEGGHLVCDRGSASFGTYQFRRSKVFGLMCRYKGTNLARSDVLLGTVSVSSRATFLTDNRWHVLLVRVDGRSATATIDGRSVKLNGLVAEDTPHKVWLRAYAPDNNDPFRLEISQLVIRQFGSVVEMEAAVQP